MMLAGGMPFLEIFKDCRASTRNWDDIVGFVGGSWQLWKNGAPELRNVGLVRGSYTFDIGAAVRGVKDLLT